MSVKQHNVRLVGLDRAGQTQLLFVQYWEAPTAEIRNQIVMLNYNLIHRGVKKWGFGREPEDVVQDAVLGLIKAVETFKEGRGAQFSTWAGWYIHQAIQEGGRRSNENQIGGSRDYGLLFSRINQVIVCRMTAGKFSGHFSAVCAALVGTTFRGQERLVDESLIAGLLQEASRTDVLLDASLEGGELTHEVIGRDDPDFSLREAMMEWEGLEPVRARMAERLEAALEAANRGDAAKAVVRRLFIAQTGFSAYSNADLARVNGLSRELVRQLRKNLSVDWVRHGVADWETLGRLRYLSLLMRLYGEIEDPPLPEQ